MPAKTLHFPSPRHLSSLYAGREENLAHAERTLGVKLVTREGWLKIEPPHGASATDAAEPIARTEALFNFLNEAQNATAEQMMMFLTRLGEDSRMVVTGDITQIDLPRSKSSGLLEVRHILTDIPGIDFHTFSGADVVRHPLVQKIIEAYDQYRNPMNQDSATAGKS